MSTAPVFTSAHLARIRPDRFTLLLIAIAVLGTGLVLARQVTYGVSLHADSIQHISTARSLLDGNGLITVWNAPYDWWPPLFPVLLVAGSFGVFDPVDVAGPLNATCFGLAVLVAGHWLRQHLRSRLLAVWGCLALATALPLAWISAWAMTEAPFILFATLGLTRASAFVRTPRRSTLLWAAVFAALACLTRYHGIAVVLVVLLILLLQGNTTARMRVRNIAGYGLISTLPIGLVFIRNYIIFGDLNSSRGEVDYSLPDILEGTIFFLGGWAGLYRPASHIDEMVRNALGITLVLAIIGIGFWILGNPGRRERWTPLYPFLLFLPVFYVFHVLGMFRGNTWHGLIERHLIPLYIPIILALLFAIDQIIPLHRLGIFRDTGKFPAIGRKTLFIMSLLLALWGWAGYGISLNVDEIRSINSREHRWGYQAEKFTGSELIDFIRTVPDQRKVWGNISNVAMYFHTGRFFSYRQIHYRIEDTISDTNIGDYLVFSKDEDINTSYTIDDIVETERMDQLFTVHDGVVFRVSETREGILEGYDAIVSGDPIANSELDIYLQDRMLVYSRESCEELLLVPTFFLHITPVDVRDLRTPRQPFGFDNLDFDFRNSHRYDPDRCIRSITLPEYPIKSIHTGQYDESGQLWNVDILFEE